MRGLYRPNVAALMVNGLGELLICERRDFKNSWQFPQGGVDAGESPLEALHRELDEELGLEPDKYQILRQEAGYHYDFPHQAKRWRKYIGQEQTYFLCKMLGTDADIRLDKHKPEFVRWKWINPEEFSYDWLPPFKHDVYRRVLRDFFSVGEDV